MSFIYIKIREEYRCYKLRVTILGVRFVRGTNFIYIALPVNKLEVTITLIKRNNKKELDVLFCLFRVIKEKIRSTKYFIKSNY